MPSDNLLAGLSGLAEGLQSGLVPMLQKKYESQFDQELLDKKFKQQKELAQYQSGLDISKEQTVQKQKSELEDWNLGQIKNAATLALGNKEADSLVKSLDPGIKLSGKDVTSMLDKRIQKMQIDANKGLMLGEKENQFQTKRLQELGKLLDPSGYRVGQFSNIYQGFLRGERLESLANAYSNRDLDQRESEELAIGLNSMLQGSNVGAQKQVEALVPKSAVGNAMKMAEWLSNNPKGLQQQQFVKRMMNDIQREKSTFKDQINRVRFQRIAPYADLEKKNPEGFESVLKSNEVDPEDYAKWKSGGYKTMTGVQPIPGQIGMPTSGGNQTPPANLSMPNGTAAPGAVPQVAPGMGSPASIRAPKVGDKTPYGTIASVEEVPN